MPKTNTNILLIYTGGTIGMKLCPESDSLVPFDFSQITEEVPELTRFGYNIEAYSFDPVIDSSDVSISFWQELARIIEKNYTHYDGFVILHGTDTMSYSASALSFMLENLEKPIVFTGSQLPIGMLRTDGKENLISAIEIASAKDASGHPIVPEVVIYFESQLYRGNRTTKFSAENFRAFRSPNAPVLADIGIHIHYHTALIRYPKTWGNPLKVNYQLDPHVAVLKLFPGITEQTITAITHTPGLRGLIIETFGSGNAPTSKTFLNCIKEAIERDIVVLNITQCVTGKVDMDAYATGKALQRLGVINGLDSTTEAATTKLFFLLGQYNDNEIVRQMLSQNIAGEITK
ncbi:MAG: type I asparaginase [Bacteroidales bacterium]|nr:type I asparaginase [Bacteroidales bacterium]